MFQWVKEIRSKSGVLHFKRYAIIETKYFATYIHKIYEHDRDPHLHSHPWSFFGIILNGSYVEQYEKNISKWSDPCITLENTYRVKRPFNMGFGTRRYFHRIHKITEGPVTTLFFTFGEHTPWYYRVSAKLWRVESEEYRRLKNNGKLPNQ